MDMFEGLNEVEIKVVQELVNKGNRSYAEISESIGVSERHLFRYRQKPHIKQAIRNLAIQELEEEIPTMMKALKKNIQRGDFRSIEMGFKALGLLVDRSEVKTTIEDNRFNGMSETAIDEELEEIENQLKVLQGGVQ
jgi:ribosomal protein S20